MGLSDNLRQHVARVSQQLAYVRNEDQTKTSLILPFIRLLGYDVFDASEVLPEYSADFGTKSGEKIDYVVMREGKPALLIEAKSARTDLHSGHASQLYRYYSTMDTRIGILTNGKSYQLFADLNKANVMDREPFIVIDMLDFDDRLVGVIEGMTKDGFSPEMVLARARELNIRREIQARFRREFDAPSADLVKHFARGLYKGSFSRSVETEFAPIVKQEWNEFARSQQQALLPAFDPPSPELSIQPKTSSPPKPADVEPVTTPISSNPAGSSFLDKTKFLERYSLDGSIEVPVFASFEGRAFEARLSLYGRLHSAGAIIRYDEEWLTPLEAGKRSRMSINPDATYYVNGMTYWQLRDPATGDLRPINDLRYDEELLRRILGSASQ